MTPETPTHLDTALACRPIAEPFLDVAAVIDEREAETRRMVEEAQDRFDIRDYNDQTGWR